MKTAPTTTEPHLPTLLASLREQAARRFIPYAGIGSRETPLEVQAAMTALATRLEQWGLVLRSGGAQGADAAFAQGTAEPSGREIYVPWAGFAGPPYEDEEIVVTDLPNYPAIERVAAEYHPNWAACRSGARKMHARNVLQMTGRSMQVGSRAVLCWTRDGRASGGTGQALRIAEARGTPIFNLQHPAVLDQVQALLAEPL